MSPAGVGMEQETRSRRGALSTSATPPRGPCWGAVTAPTVAGGVAVSAYLGDPSLKSGSPSPGRVGPRAGFGPPLPHPPPTSSAAEGRETGTTLRWRVGWRAIVFPVFVSAKETSVAPPTPVPARKGRDSEKGPWVEGLETTSPWVRGLCGSVKDPPRRICLVGGDSSFGTGPKGMCHSCYCYRRKLNHMQYVLHIHL